MNQELAVSSSLSIDATKHAYQQSVFSGATRSPSRHSRRSPSPMRPTTRRPASGRCGRRRPIADGVLLADENGYFFIFYADEVPTTSPSCPTGSARQLENVEIGAGIPTPGCSGKLGHVLRHLWSPARHRLPGHAHRDHRHPGLAPDQRAAVSAAAASSDLSHC